MIGVATRKDLKSITQIPIRLLTVPSYKHYFPTDPENVNYDNDWNNFKSAMTSVYSNIVSDSYQFVVECAATQTTAPCVEGS